jgi:hypothetical protein
MTNFCKISALTLLLLLSTLSLMIVESTLAQSTPTPAVPEFTLNVVSHPYNVPPTYATSTPNPYTGKTETIITQPGHHVENKSVEMTIKNQLFASTLDESGNYTTLYYNFKFKGHYADEWNYWPRLGSGQAHAGASQTNYTVINFGLGTEELLWDIPASGGQVDFQVQAMIGHDNKFSYIENAGYPDHYTAYSYIFTGETSNWSNTQTITILTSSTSPSPTPSVPEYPLLVILPLFAAMSLIATKFLRRKI